MTQPSRPVVAPEVQPEGILASGRPGVRVVAAANVVAALHTQAGVGLKRLAGVGVNQLHRDRPLPRDAALGRVARVSLHDAGVTPQVGVLRHQRHQRQRCHRLAEVVGKRVRLHPRRQHAALEHGRPHHGRPPHLQRIDVLFAIGYGRLGVVGRVADDCARLVGGEVHTELRIVNAPLRAELGRREQAANRPATVGRAWRG